MTAITIVGGFLLCSLICHLLFSTGPLKWIDSLNYKVEQEAANLQELGPLEAPEDPEAARKTAILPGRKEAFSKVKEAIKKEYRDTIPCAPPIMEEPKVMIDDPLTEAVANVKRHQGVNNAEALVQLLHQQVCEPDCSGPVRSNNSFSCDCGRIEMLLVKATNIASGEAQGKRYNIQR